MPAPLKHTTITEIASAVGVSRAAVSYALRGAPGVSNETRNRILRAAKALDYHPDLRLGSLMAHIRRSRLPRDRETLAFVWVSTLKSETFPFYHQVYLKTLITGVRDRAQALGCAIQEFWLNEEGMTPQRMAKILRARGICGVIFSPAMHELSISLDWPWHWFACAVIGNTEWKPALHRVGHYHYRSMWLTLERLRAEGCKRPAAILDKAIHERIHGVQMAAFQVNHPLPDESRAYVQFTSPTEIGNLRPWHSKLRPDALIVGWPVYQQSVGILRRLAPRAERLVTLDWQPKGVFPGVNVSNDLIAASAVDVVVAQLHRNERGVPNRPASLLLDGIWKE